MAAHNQTGVTGEKLAASYLAQNGYNIVATNYRYQRAEIDLIVQKNNLLVFVEVKMRSSDRHGYPEEAVQQKKIDLFLLAADAYIYQTNWLHDIRFDIIAISGTPTAFEVHHIKDAFH